jgi:hypothetical protein
MLVYDWLHSVGQNHFHVMMLLYWVLVSFRSLLLQSYASRRLCIDSKIENRILCIRPDDVIFHLDTQLSKYHPSG